MAREAFATRTPLRRRSQPMMTRYRSLLLAAFAAGAAWICFVAISPSREERAQTSEESYRTLEHSQPKAEQPSLLRSDPISTVGGREDVSLREQLSKAISDAEKLSDPARYEIRTENWQRLVAGFAAGELANVFRELSAIEQTNPTDSGRDLQLRVLQRLSEFDIRAAATVLSEMRPTIRLEACERVASQWARQDLGEAIAWIRQLSLKEDRQSALAGLAAEAVAEHPADVLALASEIQLPPERHDIISQAASRWAAVDFGGALYWARSVPDSPLRQEVVAAVAVAWADYDAKAAARLVVESMPPGPGQENALVGIVQRLATRDMKATEAWVAQFPPGQLRERAQLELERIAKR
jgi:hypothetical protein